MLSNMVPLANSLQLHCTIFMLPMVIYMGQFTLCSDAVHDKYVFTKSGPFSFELSDGSVFIVI